MWSPEHSHPTVGDPMAPISCRNLPMLVLATFLCAVSPGSAFAGTPANVLASSRAGDPAFQNESTVAVASVRGKMLIAWQEPVSGSSRIFCAASFDSGVTFVQLGIPPAP